MKCKRHPTDLSSGVGVCASCLRERLFALIVAQTRQQALIQAEAEAEAEDRRKSDSHHPPPLIFPRSVSPYIYRGSINEHHQFDPRFYTTTQVGPNSVPISAPNSTSFTAGAAPKKKHSKFSFFAFLFGSKSEEAEANGPHPRDPKVSRSRSPIPTSPSSPSSSQTWFSTLVPNRRKKQSRLFSVEDVNATDGGRRVSRRDDRGLSPVRTTVEEHYPEYDHSSGYSAECSPHQRKQGLQQPQPTPPQTTPTRDRRRGQHNRNASGLAVCFSPLVRGSPSRNPRNVGSSHVW
ncbi:uncharacterized protein LOC122086076 [Macadamia integrifolia]|uniref:uncharacterized protein LOC122086076 n=1 Tax=Macadamia integrifolia TaxID=60698 RepID=UPI001C4ECBA5|nr:uncharacterized protein LOC122086076 [Macadamia integrifolia]